MIFIPVSQYGQLSETWKVHLKSGCYYFPFLSQQFLLNTNASDERVFIELALRPCDRFVTITSPGHHKYTQTGTNKKTP